MPPSPSPPTLIRPLTRRSILLVVLFYAVRVFPQSAPVSPDRPWHSPQEQGIDRDATFLRSYRFSLEPAKTYPLAELIDLAETHNPETRVAWERARAQAATLGVARSELYPTLAALAVSQTDSFGVLEARERTTWRKRKPPPTRPRPKRTWLVIRLPTRFGPLTPT